MKQIWNPTKFRSTSQIGGTTILPFVGSKIWGAEDWLKNIVKYEKCDSKLVVIKKNFIQSGINLTLLTKKILFLT